MRRQARSDGDSSLSSAQSDATGAADVSAVTGRVAIAAVAAAVVVTGTCTINAGLFSEFSSELNTASGVAETALFSAIEITLRPSAFWSRTYLLMSTSYHRAVVSSTVNRPSEVVPVTGLLFQLIAVSPQVVEETPNTSIGMFLASVLL